MPILNDCRSSLKSSHNDTFLFGAHFDIPWKVKDQWSILTRQHCLKLKFSSQIDSSREIFLKPNILTTEIAIRVKFKLNTNQMGHVTTSTHHIRLHRRTTRPVKKANEMTDFSWVAVIWWEVVTWQWCCYKRCAMVPRVLKFSSMWCECF